jgi:dolichol kinase
MSTAEFFCLWVLMGLFAAAVGIGAALLVEYISWLVDKAGL